MDVNKNILSIAAIIIAISFGYYFVAFLPANKQAVDLSLNKSKCSQTAEDVFNTYKKDGVAGPSTTSHYSSHYNARLDKCYIEITDNSSQSTGVSILDAVENRELAWAYISVVKTQGDLYESIGINGENMDITKVQFENLERQYMSE